MPRTILICSSFYPPHFIGGAELIAHYHAKRMQERGHRVIALVGELTSRGERYSLTEGVYDGVTVFRVQLHPEDLGDQFVNFFHPRVERHFRALLDRFAPSVTHLHNLTGLSSGLITTAKQRGIVTVLTVHDHWGFCFRNTLLRDDESVCRDFSQCADCMPSIDDGRGRGIPIRLRNDFLARQFRQLDAVVSPSAYLADTYVKAGVPREKFRVIWYGVDVERFSKVTKSPRGDRLRFTFIGYFGRHKGLHVLLDAFASLPEGSPVSLNLVGDGELMGWTRERVRGGVNGAVVFTGKVDHGKIDEVFARTDVMVLPSIWPENQPITITEAMASRTPVIASRLGGIPELIADGRSGYLFAAGDAGQLAARMSEFIADPAKVSTFGDYGYALIREKSIDHQVDELLRLYTELEANGHVAG